MSTIRIYKSGSEFVGWSDDAGPVRGSSLDSVVEMLGGSRQIFVSGVGGKSYPVPVAPLKLGTDPDYVDRHGVNIFARISQSDPPARMDAAFLAGFLRMKSGFDGMVLQVDPAQSHWVRVRDGQALSIRSTLTPTLWRALELDLPEPGAQFDEAVQNVASRPTAFPLRLAQAWCVKDAETVAGAMIGDELAATHQLRSDMKIHIIASPEWGALYRHALKAQGVTADFSDINTCFAQAKSAVMAKRNKLL